MHRQLSSSLTASPKHHHQQPPPDGSGGDAAQAMAAADDGSSASHSSSSKASRGWSATARDERAIHLIPLLTFLCFLLLFLCSHDPSPADMSSFGGDGGGMRSGNRRLRML